MTKQWVVLLVIACFFPSHALIAHISVLPDTVAEVGDLVFFSANGT